MSSVAVGLPSNRHTYISKHLNLQLRTTESSLIYHIPVNLASDLCATKCSCLLSCLHSVCELAANSKPIHKRKRYTYYFEILGKPHEVKLCTHCMRNLNAMKMILTHTHTHTRAHVQHDCHTMQNTLILYTLTSLYTSLCCRQEWLVMEMYVFSCIGL